MNEKLAKECDLDLSKCLTNDAKKKFEKSVFKSYNYLVI